MHLTLLQLVHSVLDALLGHGELLDDGRDAVQSGKLEHVLVNLAGGNDRALDGDALGNERHVGDGEVAAADRQGVDGRAGLHNVHELSPVGLRAGSDQQTVQLLRHLELVLALGDDELVRAQANGLVLLAVAARQDNDAAAKVSAELDGQVAQAANAQNADSLGRPCVVRGQGRPDGGTSTHQRSSVLIGKTVGELEEECLPPDGVGGKGALVQVCRGVHGTFGAVNLLAG